MNGKKKRKGMATEAEIAAMQVRQAAATIRRLRRKLSVLPLDDYEGFRAFASGCIAYAQMGD